MKEYGNEIIKIPVFDRIVCLSKENFDKLEDKHLYKIISIEKDGMLMVGHYLIKK